MLDLTADYRPQAADLLDAAADLIEKDGWTRERYRSSDGQRCAAGALYAGTDAIYVKTLAVKTLHDWLITEGNVQTSCTCEALSCHLNLVFNWNDHTERTAHDVTTGLRKAALGLREQA